MLHAGDTPNERPSKSPRVAPAGCTSHFRPGQAACGAQGIGRHPSADYALASLYAEEPGSASERGPAMGTAGTAAHAWRRARLGVTGLLGRGAPSMPPECGDTEGRTPLMRAALCGNAQRVAELLQQGKGIGYTDMQGNVALSHAAMGGCVDTLEELLKAPRGEDYLEHRNGKGLTPLLLAAEGGHLPALQKLLERGANGRAVSVDGRCALALVCAKAPRLSLQDPGGTALHGMEAGHSAAAVRALIQAGADVNCPGVRAGKHPPLHQAARSGNVPALVTLLENGASIGFVDGEGNVALSCAAMAGSNYAVATLLEAPGGDGYINHINKKRAYTPGLGS